MSESSTDELLTATKIAQELGVSDAKVKKVIQELGLEPAAKKGVCRYYDRTTLDKIKAQLTP